MPILLLPSSASSSNTFTARASTALTPASSYTSLLKVLAASTLTAAIRRVAFVRLAAVTSVVAVFSLIASMRLVASTALAGGIRILSFIRRMATTVAVAMGSWSTGGLQAFTVRASTALLGGVRIIGMLSRVASTALQARNQLLATVRVSAVSSLAGGIRILSFIRRMATTVAVAMGSWSIGGIQAFTVRAVVGMQSSLSLVAQVRRRASSVLTAISSAGASVGTIFFPISQLAPISHAIQVGRGVVASVLGQQYNVYRLASFSSGGLTSSNPIYGNFPVRMRRTTSKVKIENAFFDLLVFEGTCNVSYLQLQDVLLETGYGSDGGVFTFAQSRPTRENLFVRTELNCSITRPMPKGGAAYQMPTSGSVATPGYGGIPKSSEEILTLTNGLYGFAATGTPANVYIGLQPLNRVKDGNSLGTPTDLYREHYVAYIPDLPGVLISELDRINAPTMDRYEVALVYTSDLTGLSGNICILEKLGV